MIVSLTVMDFPVSTSISGDVVGGSLQGIGNKNDKTQQAELARQKTAGKFDRPVRVLGPDLGVQLMINAQQASRQWEAEQNIALNQDEPHHEAA